jgi:predicted RNA methylase
VESLKEAFEVYELERDAKIYGTKISNLKLAKAVGIEVQQKKTEEQAEDYSYQSELINTTDWRRKKLAKEAIANVVNGRFV